MTEKVLRFVLKSPNPWEAMSRFHPEGKQVLNRTEWRGKPPRTCAVTNISGRSKAANDPQPTVFDIEVTCRPPGFISYVGNTRYDGWKAMVLDRAKDGTLLDGHGQALKPGEPPVYHPVDVYGDMDFNGLDFGDFIEEVETPGIKHLSYDAMMQRMNEIIEQTGRFDSKLSDEFVAPHRNRPMVKVLVADHPSETLYDGFGTQVNVINKDTPHLNHLLYVRMVQLMTDYMEGRVLVRSFPVGDDGVFVDLSDSLVDASGEGSRFNVLHEFLPSNFLDDLAKQISATFAVETQVVDGTTTGLYVRRVSSHR